MLRAFDAASDVPVLKAIWLRLGFDIAWQYRQGRIPDEVDDLSSLSEPHGPDGAMADRSRACVEIPQPCSAGRFRQTVRTARRRPRTGLALLAHLYPAGLWHR